MYMYILVYVMLILKKKHYLINKYFMSSVNLVNNISLFSVVTLTLTTLSNFIVNTLLILRCNQSKHETFFVDVKLFTLDRGNNLEQIYILMIKGK